MSLTIARSALLLLLLPQPLAWAHGDRQPGWGRSPAHRDPPAPAPGGWGRLRNGVKQMCLDAAGWAAGGSANALLWGCNNDPDHVWFLAPTGEIKNAVSGLCLTPAQGPGWKGGRKGADVGVDRCDGSRSQSWSAVPSGRGAFELRDGRRGLCLDVDGRSGVQGDDVLLWACDGGADQTWTWEPVPPPPAPIARDQREGGPHQRRGPPAVQPITPAGLQSLLRAIRGTAFSANKMAIIEEAAAYHHFLVVQLGDIVRSLSFSGNQVRAVELIAPRLLDPENGYTLFQAFAFSGDQEKVKLILEQARQAQASQARR
jgi:hypothetical protein